MTGRGVDRPAAWASRLCAGVALALAILWLSSYRWYTTAGFDFQRPWADRVLCRFVRARWDAGSIWFGQVWLLEEARGVDLDWWDPGGNLFLRSIPPPPRTTWNRLGWWSIPDVAYDPYKNIRYTRAISSRWVGIPGWIPPVASGTWPLTRWIARRSRRRPAGGTRARPIVWRSPTG